MNTKKVLRLFWGDQLNSEHGRYRQADTKSDLYWNKMPSYASLNYFELNVSLPQCYWTGKILSNTIKIHTEIN